MAKMTGIFETGFLKPTPAQLSEAKKRATSDFCSAFSSEFAANLPAYSMTNRTWSPESGILLTLKNVEPHTDDWVGRGQDPRVRRSIFWMLSRKNTVWFWAKGSDPIQLAEHQFVVFDDSRLHSVMSDGKWVGAAWQIRKCNSR